MADTVRTIAALQALLADNTEGDISPQDLRDMLVSLDDGGWVDYVDTQYTEAAPFSVMADTDTVVPNNAGTVRGAYKPRDVPTFYDGSVITGRPGDHLEITIDMKVLPTSAATTYFEFWFDIGGGVGELYRRIISFPKGNGIVRPLTATTGVYTLETWEANGATVFCRANGSVDIYDIRFVIARNFRGSRITA